MQGLFFRPFINLDENDLRDLVEVRKVREHIHLDYKLETYPHGHSGAVEMLTDVTAMANAQGGYILIGVEEDRTEPDGTPKQLIGIENGDKEATWIQSVCLSSIDEKIIGLHVRDIPLANGRSCVVVQIPNSIRKPHMIVHERHRSFRIRHGRANDTMGMQEVRNMILNMNTYRASLAGFIQSRKSELATLAKGEPWLLLMATPIYVDTDKIDPLRQDVRDLIERSPGAPDRTFERIRIGRPKPRIFGIETTDSPKRTTSPYERALRLFRNGHLEYCENCLPWAQLANGWPSRPMPIYSYRVTVTLWHFLEVARQIMQLGELSEPIAITAYFENFNPSYLHQRQKECPSSDIFMGEFFIWREPELSIDLTVSELSDVNNVARLIIDRLFNAFGYEDNLHFDTEGHFKRLR